MEYGFMLLASAVISYLSIIPDYFPSLGASLSFVTLASFIMYFKKHRQLSDWFYLFLTLLLSCFLFIRTNPFMIFLDTIAIFYFGSLLILSHEQRNMLSFTQSIFLPFSLLIKATKIEHTYKLNWQSAINNKHVKDQKIKDFIISLTLGVIVLLVIVPLLSYANPIFGNYVNSFFKFFDLEKFLHQLFKESFIIYFGRTVLFGLLIILLPRLLTYVSRQNHPDEKQKSASLPLFMPMILTAIVLAVFFITQIQLYMASSETLKQLGITHSEYAREVFGQLSVVAFIIFILIYNNQQKSSPVQTLSYILILEGIFLTLIAFKSDLDYASEFGFTHKRLWGFVGVAWFIWLFMLFLYREVKKLSRELFVHDLVVFSGILLVIVNMLNFDYVIYHYSKSRTGEGIDYSYMANTLSADSLAYKELIQKVHEQGEQTRKDDLYYMYRPMSNMIWKVRDLQQKYKHIDWRAFNYTEYKQYQEIKDINVEIYEKAYSNTDVVISK